MKTQENNLGERFKTLTPYLLIALLILLSVIIFKNCKGDLVSPNDINPKTIYKYKTDSIYKRKYYELLRLHNIKTPPLIVERWLTPEKEIDSVNVIPGYLLVYIKGLQDSLKINQNFVVNYPKAPKLIDFTLKKDSLVITTFDNEARLFTNRYPLYLNNFNYQWYDNDLHRKETSYPGINKTKLKWNQFYINSGYSLTQSKPLIGFEYNLTPGRFKFDLDADFTLEQNPNFIFKAKLGYLLFD